MDTPLEPVARMTRDIANAALHLSDTEARYMVDLYYLTQDDRKRAHNQERALDEAGEPNSVITYLADQAETLESQIKRALDKYTAGHPMGAWMREVHGIGPVISAGLLAHIDIDKCDTVGDIWRFAGLDPTVTWGKGQKRPFNAKLKVICWKAGQSFMKSAGSEQCYYGHIYRARKAEEWINNLDGKFADQAAKKAVIVGKTTEAWSWYNGCYSKADIELLRVADNVTPDALKKIAMSPGAGVAMLPPAHIDARARRYAVKIFLYDLFAAWYRKSGRGEPPKPWIIEHGGHAHLRVPPQGH